MDVFFVYRGQVFVWDQFKATSNFKRHGVSFEQASEVFFDPLATIEDATGGDEPREAAIGQVAGSFEVFYVVHLVREDEVIRIISARCLTRSEKRRYEQRGTFEDANE